MSFWELYWKSLARKFKLKLTVFDIKILKIPKLSVKELLKKIFKNRIHQKLHKIQKHLKNTKDTISKHKIPQTPRSFLSLTIYQRIYHNSPYSLKIYIFHIIQFIKLFVINQLEWWSVARHTLHSQLWIQFLLFIIA